MDVVIAKLIFPPPNSPIFLCLPSSSICDDHPPTVRWSQVTKMNSFKTYIIHFGFILCRKICIDSNFVIDIKQSIMNIL